MWKGVILILSIISVSNGWFFNNVKPAEERKEVEVPGNSAPFELKTADEQFLLQAEFTSALSALDLCHHMVISEIEGTCTDLSEEGLNKLAVMLLNCQSEAEGRPTYPCTPDMAIGECTAGMDGVTWNAYQITASRARAVCYATRQQYFRQKTEWTVNKLLTAAGAQTRSLAEMQSQQAAVGAAAAQTLRSIEAGQEALAERQRQLDNVHQVLHGHISTNLRDLTREKALIAAGHAELAQMTEDIKNKLDETSAHLAARWAADEANHAAVADGLDSITHATSHVLQKIDDSSRSIKELQNETEKHYKDTLQNLEKVNRTIQYVVRVVQDTSEVIETKVNWVLSLVGGTGERLARLCTLTLHLAYLVLAGACCAFLRTPTFSRVLLLLLVPTNCWAELHRRPSLGFLPMTAFITLTTLGNWAASWVLYLLTSQKSDAATPVDGGVNSATCSGCIMSAAGDQTPVVVAGVSEPAERRRSSDVRRLIETLEKLYASGVLTPKVAPAETIPQEPLVPFNTPTTSRRPHLKKSHNILSSVQDDQGEVQVTKQQHLANTPRKEHEKLGLEHPQFHMNEPEDIGCSVALYGDLIQQKEGQGVTEFSLISDDEEWDGEPVNAAVTKAEKDFLKLLESERNSPKIGNRDSPNVKLSDKESSDKESPKLSLVRRHLLKSVLATPPRSRAGSPADSPPPSPAPTASRRSTPVRTPGGRTPGRGSRPTCLAATKAGLPCRNPAMDGSGFCHKHQTTPLKHGNNSNVM